ncbi:DUF2264 domain-containing protein [Parafrigoribacterium soli]|uniref:DUF2264 domain-containing protein n=1 Tax=Parafrigoribacterium soli TaxID=3144663 RepID=UPI0032EC1192
MTFLQSDALGTSAAGGDWSRAQWLGYADRLLSGVMAWASPGNARITPPGAEGGYGTAVDGLEGFARSFLLAGFRIAGERGQGLDELIDFYVKGIETGVDPAASDRWVRLDEHPQAKVEAASIALILDLTREWIWERLDGLTRDRVIEYLSPVVGDTSYPQTNWVWFRIVVQTFLRSVGGPWSERDIADDLARHDSFIRQDGWLSDGDERSFDHYVGWALHLYPALWARMRGAAELAHGRTERDVAALDRYLLDAVRLVGADGSPLIQGRSLIYRFAAAAPFWVGVIAEVPSLSPGLLRTAAGRVVSHFSDHGVPDAQGLLTMGWHGPWRTLAQSYSGPASPYWAAKGLLGIALPADHPVWSAPAEPLPIQLSDDIRSIRAAGWLVSATQEDGIVRVTNHGTDHARQFTMVGDSPLYARLGYSTATAPLLDAQAWNEPLEQSVCLVDGDGAATHRAAIENLGVRVQDDEGGRVGIAASTSLAHWIAPAAEQHRHGSGIEGEITVAGRLTVCSIIRGAWEVRLSLIESLREGVETSALRLRVGGWPLTGEPRAHVDSGTAHLVAGATTSGLYSLLGTATATAVRREDASPLGPAAVVPTLEYEVTVGEWTGALVTLTGAPAVDRRSSLNLATVEGALTASIIWPDGVATTSRLIELRTAAVADR